MAHRRILLALTVLGVLLLVGSLSLVIQARTERAGQPARIELSQAMVASLNSLNDRLDALAKVGELADLRQARGDLAEVVLAFDQDLLALAETVRDREVSGAVTEIQTIWRGLGLGLADLAAGEYAANSAAGRRTAAFLRRDTPALREHLQAITSALQAVEDRAGRRSGAAATAAAILGGLTLLLGLTASRPPRAPSSECGPAVLTPSAQDPAAGQTSHGASRTASPLAGGLTGYLAASRSVAQDAFRPAGPCEAHGDLGLASAAVDRVTMDMGTVARSAERMQLAVDSVASALQGMLFSLNEMAQDTLEGSRLTRTAHNAALYAADTARELLDSAREMGAVVARVRTLAARSQEIAGRIDADAAATGATGEAFTSVVAMEVKQLASATTEATAHIEATVDEVLAGQRQYEEAIGQIIKNIGVVRKVAASMGELMLAPPARVQPGIDHPEPAPAQAAAPWPEPAPAPPDPADAADDPIEEMPDDLEPDLLDPAEILQNADDLAAAADSLLDELAEVAAETGVPSQQQEGAEPPPADPSTEEAPAEAAEAAEAAEPASDNEDAEGGTSETPEPGSPDGNSSVFMLNGPRRTATSAPEPASAPEAEAAPEPAPEQPPEPAAETAPQTESAAQTEDDALEPEPVATASGPARPRPVAQGSSGNIFMLNKPKK